MIRNEITIKNTIIILLASEFDESETVYCMEHLRRASLSVCLVGQSSGLVKGKHGLIVRPDFSLDELASEAFRLVIIPGGKMCSSSLMSDPRVHRLLNNTLNAKSFVAALSAAESVLIQAGFPLKEEPNHFIKQGPVDTPTFTNDLIKLIAG